MARFKRKKVVEVGQEEAKQLMDAAKDAWVRKLVKLSAMGQIILLQAMNFCFI